MKVSPGHLILLSVCQQSLWLHTTKADAGCETAKNVQQTAAADQMANDRPDAFILFLAG